MIDSKQPLATMLLICFNQEDSIDAALEGALAQDYTNLEIVISDDASSDNTYGRICAKLVEYKGPHRIKLLQNPQNLGIGGNIDQAVRQSEGELIFITAGDDVSLSERVSTVVTHWLQRNCQPDLIAAYLNDIDLQNNFHGVITISNLAAYGSLEDWSRMGPPHVIGAAQAWTRRLFDRFGGIPSGVVGEDMVMAFRAISTGSAITIPIPLVNYRRGGITSNRRSLSTKEVIKGLTRKLKSSQTELRCLIKEAEMAGASHYTISYLTQKLDKEIFIENMFGSSSLVKKLKFCYLHDNQTVDFRIRIFVYAAAPWLLAPFFYLKRKLYR